MNVEKFQNELDLLVTKYLDENSKTSSTQEIADTVESLIGCLQDIHQQMGQEE